MLINVYKIYTGPVSVQVQYSRLCPISSSFRYNGSLFSFNSAVVSLYNLGTDLIETTNFIGSFICACLFVA
jgi:hypothetical protein